MALLKHKAPLHATDGQMCALSLLSSLDRPSPVAVWKTGGLFKPALATLSGLGMEATRLELSLIGDNRSYAGFLRSDFVVLIHLRGPPVPQDVSP